MKPMRVVLFLIAAGITATAPVSAFGDLELYDTTLNVSYDATSGTEMYGVTRIYHRGEPQAFFLTFSPGSSGTFGERTMERRRNRILRYQLHPHHGSTAVLKDLTASPTPEEVLSGTTPEHTGLLARTLDVNFFIRIPPGQSRTGGNYADTLTIRLYRGTLDAHTEVSSATLRIEGPVQNSIRIHLAPPAGSFNTFSPATARTLDFGSLTTGSSLGSDLLVEANCAFTISLESEYGSVMKNPAITDGSAVPYVLSFDGARVDLPARTPVKVADSPGYRYPIVVTIGDMGVQSAGTYRDVVSITVTAR